MKVLTAQKNQLRYKMYYWTVVKMPTGVDSSEIYNCWFPIMGGRQFTIPSFLRRSSTVSRLRVSMVRLKSFVTFGWSCSTRCCWRCWRANWLWCINFTNIFSFPTGKMASCNRQCINSFQTCQGLDFALPKFMQSKIFEYLVPRTNGTGK